MTALRRGLVRPVDRDMVPAMDEDDLPPRPLQNDAGFAGELGRTVAMTLGIGVFLAIAGLALFFIMRWSGHSPW